MQEVKRVISSHLRIVHRSFLTRRGNRCDAVRSATAIEYTPEYIRTFGNNRDHCERMIDAEAIHKDEQAFWTERQKFYRTKERQNYFPLWDRQAQLLIMFTRQVSRVPQEAAFRLFTLGLKLLLLPRLTLMKELLLTPIMLMSAEAVLSQSVTDAKNNNNIDNKELKDNTSCISEVSGESNSNKNNSNSEQTNLKDKEQKNEESQQEHQRKEITSDLSNKNSN